MPVAVTPPPVAPQPTQPPAEVKPPISDEDYAKNAIKAVVTELCKAYEDLSPEGVQQVYPTVNMAALKQQLNKSQYKSASCKAVGEPTYNALDPAAGTAKIRVETKRIFEHAALDPKPDWTTARRHEPVAREPARQMGDRQGRLQDQAEREIAAS